MKNVIIILFIFSVYIQNIFPQTNNFKEYLPLNIGNTWVYYYDVLCPFGTASGYDRYKIISTYNANGKTYFKFVHVNVIIHVDYGVQSRLFMDTSAIRIDTLSGNIYRNISCSNSPELLVDSLNAKLGDTSFTCYPQHGDKVLCTDTTSISYFGVLRNSRKFYMPGFEGYNFQIYAKNLGLTGFTYNQLNYTCWVSLRGCIINGVVYGDTSMVVGINQISQKLPVAFSLSQNYPNPFNPVTKIKFQIPLSRGVTEGRGVLVRLVIYDVLGREIAMLVNQQLKPGTYEVEWEGTNYPSGVYFYKLVAGDPSTSSGQGYSETRKMVLIK